MASETTSFEILLNALAAAGEPTRLRLLALLAEAELTVTELVTILGQSQPRISRHLKLLLEGGLVERHREGAGSVFLAGAAGESANCWPISLQHSPRRMRRARPTAAVWQRCAAPAPSRPPAISPPMRRTGTSSAPCTSVRNGSKLPLQSSRPGALNAARSRHRHRPDARTVRAARRTRRRPRSVADMLALARARLDQPA